MLCCKMFNQCKRSGYTLRISRWATAVLLVVGKMKEQRNKRRNEMLLVLVATHWGVFHQFQTVSMCLPTHTNNHAAKWAC